MPDLRAVFIAVAAWAGAVVGWQTCTRPPLLLVAVLVTGGLALWLPSARPLAVVSLTTLAVAVVGFHSRLVPEPVVGRGVHFLATATSLPHHVAVDVGRPPLDLVFARASRISLGAQVWDVDIPVSLAIQGGASPDIGPGAQISGRGVLDQLAPGRTSAPVQVAAPPEVVGPGVGWASIVAGLRDGLWAAASGGGDSAAASLVSGMALGDESHQSPELAETMRAAGLSHLTAVSGGNFVVVMGVVLLALRLLRRSLAWQVGGAAVTLVAYSAVVGPQASVLRAGVMAAVGLLGVASGGVPRGVALLSGTVFGLLLISPELALSLGFALSVVATAALLALAGSVADRLGVLLPGRLAAAVAVALTAHAATTPVLALTGATQSWVAVPANMAVAVLVGPVTVLGVAATVLAVLSQPLATVVAWPAAKLAHLIVAIGEIGQDLAVSAAGAGVVRAFLSVVAVTAATAALLWLTVAIGRSPTRFSVVGVVAASLLLAFHLRASGTSQEWRVIVCDVGQGTAVLIHTRVGPVLFDTGPRDGAVTDCLADAGVDDLTAIVVSHFHADHVGGMESILATRTTYSMISAAAAAPSPIGADTHRAVEGAGVPEEVASAGDSWRWGDVTATVLWPPSDRHFGADDANNGSLVIALVWDDGLRVLIPGDVEPESQAQIMRTWRADPFDIVVVPHHGSDHQDAAFARWAQPAVAVASTGAGNSYGHPAPQTIQEYQDVGALVRRTDLDGPMAASTADGTLTIR